MWDSKCLSCASGASYSPLLTRCRKVMFASSGSCCWCWMDAIDRGCPAIITSKLSQRTIRMRNVRCIAVKKMAETDSDSATAQGKLGFLESHTVAHSFTRTHFKIYNTTASFGSDAPTRAPSRGPRAKLYRGKRSLDRGLIMISCRECWRHVVLYNKFSESSRSAVWMQA